jgi:predicted ester cyclase
VGVLDELLTPDFTSHFLSGAGGVGRDQLKQIDAVLFATLPDLRVTMEDVVTEGDRVAVRYSSRATPVSNPLGAPLSGTGMDIFRIADGKIAQRWAEMDYTGMLMQIGAAADEGAPVGE